MAHSGTVKRWKGSFGFIAPDEGGDDIFVHQTVIKLEGFRSLVAEEKVSYDLETDDAGKSKAINLAGPDGGPLKGLWKDDETPLTGTVARWRTDKGFGFIKPDTEGEDIFVHRSVISAQEDAEPGLTQGEKVEYTVTEENGRTKAGKVTGVFGRPVKGEPKQEGGGDTRGAPIGGRGAPGAPGGYAAPAYGGGYGGNPGYGYGPSAGYGGGGGYAGQRYSPYGRGPAGYGGKGDGRY